MFTPKLDSDWLKCSGTLQIQEKENRVAIKVGNDFVNYYLWFIQRHFKITPSTSRHGAHISLVLPKFHKNIKFSALKKWENSKIDFEYDPNVRVGGKSKGFMNFWVPVRSEKIERIKLAAGVMDRGELAEPHLTICNTKSGLVPWQPKMIEIARKVQLQKFTSS